MRNKHAVLEFLIVLSIGLGVFCISIFIVSSNTTYKYPVELWNYGQDFLNIIYPLIFSIPFCWILFCEKSGGYWKNVFNRVAIKKYLRRRIFVATLSSAVAMILISLGGFLLANLIARGTLDYEPILTNKFHGLYQIESPCMYALILSCWRAVLAALYTLLGFGIALISKNIFIAMTGTFVYSMVENFVTAILQMPEISMTTSFYPNRLVASAITIPKLIVGPVVISIIIIAIYIYYWIKARNTLMD